MSPGVSSQPTTDTQWNQWRSRVFMVNPLSVPCSPTHVLTKWWKYLTSSHFRTLFHGTTVCLSVCLSFSYHVFSFFHLLCQRQGFRRNMTWMAYQKTWLTLQHEGFSFSAWFHYRTIGHLKSELYFQSHCSNSIRTLFEEEKNYLWAFLVWQRWLNWKMAIASTERNFKK